jgi:hypothetical protein
MPQLTTLDAGFLKAEATDQHASLALGAVAVVKGAVPNYGRIKALLAERIPAIPRSTQVLRGEWVDYPGFDLAHHVRRVALPRPGDDAELFGAMPWSVPSTWTAHRGSAGSSRGSKQIDGRS